MVRRPYLVLSARSVLAASRPPRATPPELRAGCPVYNHRVPAAPVFISYAQNREDVVLWRALNHVRAGRYVEVGSNHPRNDSVTRAFYDRGWSGVTVEPMHEFAEAHRAERPRDTMIEAVITDEDTDQVVLHEIANSGLSSVVDSVGDQHREGGEPVVDRAVPALRLSDVLTEHGGPDQVIHFMLVDTEGSEPQVLASVDLRTFRPWVLVIESTAPNSTEQTHSAWEAPVLAAGYQFCLFDGLSRFYVADEHVADLAAALAYPACVLDTFVEARAYGVWQERAELVIELRRWRAEALRWWSSRGVPDGSSDAPRSGDAALIAAQNELSAVRATLSWRITRPIRAIRGRIRLS